jgi:hypothetical protein
VNKMAVLREHALRHDRVDMTVPVDQHQYSILHHLHMILLVRPR